MKTVIRKKVSTVVEMARLKRAAKLLFDNVKVVIYGKWDAADSHDSWGELINPTLAFLNGGAEVLRCGRYTVRAILDGVEQSCKPYELPFTFELECSDNEPN